MRIYKPTDKIKVQIDDAVFYFSPLTSKQKAEVTGMLQGLNTQDPSSVSKMFQAQKHALQLSLKDVEGIEDAEGNKWELEFENNMVSDDCAEQLLNCENSNQISSACLAFLQGVPKEITDNDGNPIEGVTVLRGDNSSKKRRRAQ